MTQFRAMPLFPATRRLVAWPVLGGVAIAVLSVLDHAGAFGPHRDDYAHYHDRSARVTRVIDAASVEIDLPDGRAAFTRVHLAGVRAEDESDDATPLLLARDMLKDARVRLVLDDHRPMRDAEHRLIAYLWSENDRGLLYNEEFIRTGLAMADRESRTALRLRFIRQEDAAKRRGDGIWAVEHEKKRTRRR